MSEDNSIQPQEDKLISQAKKRLLGASVILFILLISAPFVLKNRNEEGPTEPIKISMESSPEIVDVNVESIKLPETKQEIPESSGSQIKKEAVILPSSGMYIQFGIFSDNEKIKALQQKLNQKAKKIADEKAISDEINDGLKIALEDFKGSWK